MTRRRVFALVAVPAALLVGSAAPTLAANASGSGAATPANSVCGVPAADAVVTVVMVDPATRRPRPLPEEFARLLPPPT